MRSLLAEGQECVPPAPASSLLCPALEGHSRRWGRSLEGPLGLVESTLHSPSVGRTALGCRLEGQVMS